MVCVLGDTTYGSCCVDDVAAQHVGTDAIIHFGHYCLSPSFRVPVLFIFEKLPIDVPNFVTHFKKAFPNQMSRILLLYDVAYKHAIDEITGIFMDSYPSLAVSRLMLDEPGTDGSYSVLGRKFDIEAVDIDKYEVVFIGQDSYTIRIFAHALPGVQFHVFDPSIHQCIERYDFDRSRFHRKRMFLIEKVKAAKILGILIGTLSVANYRDAVQRIKSLTKRMGKKCFIIAVGKPNVAKLANFPEVEAYVLVACPENSLMDSKEFFQPIVTMYEVELALNTEQVWSEKHITDFRTLLPGGCNYFQEKVMEKDVYVSNVSLVSGPLSPIQQSDELLEETKEYDTIISLKHDTTVSASSSGYALSSRSWRGLEEDLGKTKVELASLGRQGIPQQYNNEPHVVHDSPND